MKVCSVEQFGEYFGASLCTVDFDGDGLDDVVVGAPLFSSDMYPDVGKVYVYVNRGKVRLMSDKLVMCDVIFDVV